MRVNSRNFCLDDGIGEALDPPFRLPLVCVVAPYDLIAVGCLDANLYFGALRNRDLMQICSIYSAHRLRELQHSILHGPVKAPCEQTRTVAQKLAYSRTTRLTGECLWGRV